MKIVVFDPIGFKDEHLAMLIDAAGDHTVVLPAEQDLVSEMADAEVFIGYHTPEIFTPAPKLKWIQTAAAGLDMMLTPEVIKRGLIVTNASGLHAAPVVETAWALTLAVSRHLKTFHQDQNEHQWNPFIPDDLDGRTVGIVGLGGIGRRYARVAAAFGMRVIAVDRHSPPKPDEVESLQGLDKLNDLVAAADVLLVSCPATAETQGLIGPEQIGLLKPTAILINIARGGIVDEPALIECLTEGRIMGAGLDVTAVEPLPEDDPLWETPRLIITPHIAGWSGDRSKRLVEFFCDNLHRYRSGEPLRNLVDQSRGYPVPAT
ncbi:MAG: D-2-hydroxyacid dehydrogenase [Fuerstiella sp.]|nr:D-2-hydroxyacid dehydrogenase [Fuerstiella sp.]